MCAARRQRLTREAIGGVEVPFPEKTVRNITVVALALLLAIAALPPREKRQWVSVAEARAASAVHEAPAASGSATLPDEGNVVDMTY
jgi:hypothetical protein